MPSLSVQTAAPQEQNNQEETANPSVNFASEYEPMEEEDLDESSHFFDCNDHDDESDDEMLDLIEDVQYLMRNEGQPPKWKDVDNAHEGLVVHLDYARNKAFTLCKEETKFVKMRIERRLNGASSKSFKNLMDILK